MKKLIIVLIFSMIMVFIGISGQNNKIDGAKHELYIPNDVTIYEQSGVKITETGPFKIVECNAENVENIRGNIPTIYGETVAYKCSERELRRVIRDKYITIYDDIDENGTRNIYGYSPFGGQGVMHEGKLVNMHINYGNNMIRIGTPLIMGSY